MIRLEAGDKAPDFQGLNQDGEKVRLKDFNGKKLVLYFYPDDDTPACTAEACDLRDNIYLLKKNGYEVVGVSINDVKSHEKFAKKYSLPFPLIADPGKKILDAYGVWGEKNLYGRKFMGTLRTTFLINEKGVIDKIIRKVITKKHTAQILK